MASVRAMRSEPVRALTVLEARHWLTKRDIEGAAMPTKIAKMESVTNSSMAVRPRWRREG
ncbi:hypothetical protein D3C87_1464850 [compost metagenome]